MKAYTLGQPVELTGAFADEDGDAVDPAEVRLLVLPPDGVQRSYVFDTDDEIENPSVGTFVGTLADIDQAGDWSYKWESDEPGQAAQTGQFAVEGDAFTEPA